MINTPRRLEKLLIPEDSQIINSRYRSDAFKACHYRSQADYIEWYELHSVGALMDGELIIPT